MIKNIGEQHNKILAFEIHNKSKENVTCFQRMNFSFSGKDMWNTTIILKVLLLTVVGVACAFAGRKIYLFIRCIFCIYGYLQSLNIICNKVVTTNNAI